MVLSKLTGREEDENTPLSQNTQSSTGLLNIGWVCWDVPKRNSLSDKTHSLRVGVWRDGSGGR